MLLEALVACAGVTLKAVATALDIPLKSGAVSAEGDLDFRGTLGVAKDAPVGFRADPPALRSRHRRAAGQARPIAQAHRALLRGVSDHQSGPPVEVKLQARLTRDATAMQRGRYASHARERDAVQCPPIFISRSRSSSKWPSPPRFVLAATVTAERAGPLVGGLVATLPIGAGPVYIFLALDHDAHFIAQSALGSLVINAVNVVFALIYALLAQKRSLVVSLAGAFAVWFALALGDAARSPGRLARRSPLNVVVLGVCLVAGRAPLRHAPMPRVHARWYDLRAARGDGGACWSASMVTLELPHRADRQRQSGGVPDRAHQHHDHSAPPRRRAGRRRR